VEERWPFSAIKVYFFTISIAIACGFLIGDSTFKDNSASEKGGAYYFNKNPPVKQGANVFDGN